MPRSRVFIRLASIFGKQLLEIARKKAILAIPTLEELASHGDKVLDLRGQDFDSATKLDGLNAAFGDDVMIGAVCADPMQ